HSAPRRRREDPRAQGVQALVTLRSTGRLLGVALLAGSTMRPASAQIRNPDTFVYAMTGDIDSLDPDWEYDSISHTAMWQMYETLVFYKGPSVTEFEPMISTIVPSEDNGLISKDGMKYTFPVRTGVSFHDGSPMTPEDVRYSILRFMLTDRSGGPSNLLL